MLNKFTIKSRLIFILALLSLLAVGLGVLGLLGMSKTKEGLRSVYEDRTVPMDQLADIQKLMLVSRLRITAALLNPTANALTKAANIAERNMKEVDHGWSEYTNTVLTPEEKILSDKFAADLDQFKSAGLNPTIAAMRANDIPLAKQLLDEKLKTFYDPPADGIQALFSLQLNVAKQEYVDVVSRYENTRIISISAICIGVILGTLMSILLIRGISGSLANAQEVAAAIASGDLSSEIDTKQQDEIGKLLFSLSKMQQNLKSIVGEIREATDTINTGAKEIASGNSDLSQRTEEQASGLEEAASSMEELTVTVKQNAENAKQANQLAIGSSDVAGKGGTLVGQVVQTMESINESSRKIVDIISVIDGIAFQTNILALNAAVEAARAGEQGRGFAVVASEVRNLAQRSAGAAKEIKALIGDSVEKVEGGSKLVAEAGHTMDEIVSSIRRVTDIVSEIAAASHQQSTGIEQVNLAISQMDEMTQQNAALVEQAAAAAESMEEQAQKLAVSVSIFKLDSGSANLALLAPAGASASAAIQPVSVRPAIPHAVAGSDTQKKKPTRKPKDKNSNKEEWEEF